MDKAPMGWNSYDYYDTTVNEAQVKANADYMAAHLKDAGWEYIVVDIEWYARDSGTMGTNINISRLAMRQSTSTADCFRQRTSFPLPQVGKGLRRWQNIYIILD